MKTTIHSKFNNTPEIQQANSILRSCVHCGFCTATCPTYQLLGDELDSPRGRIYLIKNLLEGATVTRKTQLHLDRCLTCRSCETTCPSGVRYSRLLDIGRGITEKNVQRPVHVKLIRWTLRQVLSRPKLFSILLNIGQSTSVLLPGSIKKKIPPRRALTPWPKENHTERKMLVLEGCAQPSATPNTNAATARILNNLGITLLRAPQAGCCGAVNYHLSSHDAGLYNMRKNIDAWWPYIEAGAEAIVITASGCGAMINEYAELLTHDPMYFEKAKRVTELAKDISDIIINEDISKLKFTAIEKYKRIAFQSPCTLQHAQKITGTIENILIHAGYQLTQVADSHLCCGSSGTYSILQPKLAQQLLNNKLKALQEQQPECIVTANIGCQLHLETKSTIPVKHWIELLDENSSANL